MERSSTAKLRFAADFVAEQLFGLVLARNYFQIAELILKNDNLK